MIVLKSGLKLPPLPFEEAVLKELPIANQAVLIGDGHEFPVCVVTLKVATRLFLHSSIHDCLWYR